MSADVLNKGGVGAIHRTDDPGLVYKEYFDSAKAPRRADLDRLVAVGRSVLLEQGKAPGDTPESSVNWPVDLVLTPSGRVKGVVLPIIPAALQDSALNTVRTLDFLVMARAKPPASRARVALLIRMAEILDFVHSRGLVHGDVNGKNLAWSVDPNVIMYLIDCDGMVPQSPPPVAGVQAMGWTDPRVIDRVIPAHDHLSDRYALALAMYRGLLLTPGKLDQKSQGRWPEPGKIPSDMPASVATLLRRGLAALDGESRSTPREWVTALVETYVPNGSFASRELDALDRASARAAPVKPFVPLPPVPSQPTPTPVVGTPTRRPGPPPSYPQRPPYPQAPSYPQGPSYPQRPPYRHPQPPPPQYGTPRLGGVGRHALDGGVGWYIIGALATFILPYFAVIYIGIALLQLRNMPAGMRGLARARTSLIVFGGLSVLLILSYLANLV